MSIDTVVSVIFFVFCYAIVVFVIGGVAGFNTRDESEDLTASAPMAEKTKATS